MALSLGLVKIAGATRCNKWGTRLEGNKQIRKQSFSVSLPEWLSDSMAHVKRVKKELKEKPSYKSK
jgi:hypothetical protein